VAFCQNARFRPDPAAFCPTRPEKRPPCEKATEKGLPGGIVSHSLPSLHVRISHGNRAPGPPSGKKPRIDHAKAVLSRPERPPPASKRWFPGESTPRPSNALKLKFEPRCQFSRAIPTSSRRAGGGVLPFFFISKKVVRPFLKIESPACVE
jgi:hypothetical protein